MKHYILTSIFFLLITLAYFAQDTTANRRVSYGESCNRIKRCDSRGALACKNGKCDCVMSEVMSYDPTYARCYVHAGEKCVYTAIESESRLNERSWREELPCVNNAQCQDGFCTCFPGFFEGANGTCEVKRSHREDCETDAACREDQYQICTKDKVCDCHNKTSTYDFSRQSCVRRAGQACSDLQICVDNAYCTNPPQTAEYTSGVVCQCVTGYFANEDGTCERKRGYGEPCKYNDYCFSDDYTKLTCGTKGICSCDESMSTYDNSSNTCRRLAGASCESFQYCVENSDCGGSSGSYEIGVPAKCECRGGYFQTVNGTCELRRNYGEQCEDDSNCQSGLKCGLFTTTLRDWTATQTFGRCKCDETKSVYDGVKKACVGLVNSTCQSSEGCITNSLCSWTGEDRQCICLSGFTESSNGSCLASYGMTCSTSWTDSCNKESGLICKEGKCECKYKQFQAFDPALKKCVSSVNGPCDDKITPCVSNAFCKSESNDFHTSRRCQCNQGYIEVNGICQLTIGQSCNFSQSESDSERCDRFAPLYCIEGTCQCDSQMTYDKDSNKCQGLVEASCNTTDVSPCVNGATCKKLRVTNSPLQSGMSTGICKCQLDWKTLENGTCTNHTISPFTRAKVSIIKVKPRDTREKEEEEEDEYSRFNTFRE